MVKRRSTYKRSLRRDKRSKRGGRRTRKNMKGAGWSDGPDYIKMAPGNLIHHPYSGPGKDCTGNPESIRPGYISDYTAKGLPGLSGGARRMRKRRGGMPLPNNATVIGTTSGGALVVANPDAPPTNGSITPLPETFPNPSGSGGSVSAPGVPPKVAQAGGRYGFFPDMGPLNPVNGVGVTPAPFGRIPCETGTFNPLNPDPNGVQTMSTAPLTPAYMKGGAAFPPIVNVGNFDSMKYEAPTAGYRNDFMTFNAPSPVPGLTIQTPYDARSFNQGCIKTGGGAASIGIDAGVAAPLKMGEITTRSDFDGSKGLLPMKFGGKRRTRKARRTARKASRKNKNRK